MKKISFWGIVLGFIAGALVALTFGSWLFWLSLGIAIGVLLGSFGARITRRTSITREANF